MEKSFSLVKLPEALWFNDSSDEIAWNIRIFVKYFSVANYNLLDEFIKA